MFDAESTIQVILYVVNKLGDCDIHKLNKILYFADEEHLSKYGRSITGDVYIAMDFGPVPSGVRDILSTSDIEGASIFNIVPSNYIKRKNKKTVVALRDADMDYLSETDIECLDRSIEKCKDISFKNLSKLSHSLAWQNTERNKRISVMDILREAGDSEDYIAYIKEKQDLELAFNK